MAVMFVHGVPATSRLWRQVIDHIDRDDKVVAVDLPGLAAPSPDGWDARKESYVSWLIDRVEHLAHRSGPIHLVGHDWGCLLVLRAASLRPELLRSVAAGNGPIDEHWPLHALWNVWNRPGLGERFMDRALTAERVEMMLTSVGFPAQDAAHSAFATTEGRRSILELYRSATNIGTEWAEDLRRIIVPSMLIWGIRDLIVPVEIGRRMAARIGAEMVELDSDHFWPYECPKATAANLTRFWKRVESKQETILTQNIDVYLRWIEESSE